MKCLNKVVAQSTNKPSGGSLSENMSGVTGTQLPCLSMRITAGLSLGSKKTGVKMTIDPHTTRVFGLIFLPGVFIVFHNITP